MSCSRNLGSLNALSIMSNPSFSYAFNTCTHNQQTALEPCLVRMSAHRLGAAGAAVIRGADDGHVPELREEAAQLVRHLSEHTLRGGRLCAVAFLAGQWRRRCVNSTISFRESSIKAEQGVAYPCGCWRSETRSSTAVEAAIDARPGRVTVHIWSSVRSVSDYMAKTPCQQ